MAMLTIFLLVTGQARKFFLGCAIPRWLWGKFTQPEKSHLAFNDARFLTQIGVFSWNGRDSFQLFVGVFDKYLILYIASAAIWNPCCCNHDLFEGTTG